MNSPIEPKEWRPEIGETYWYYYETLKGACWTFSVKATGGNYDEAHFAEGNMHKTREGARKAYEDSTKRQKV